MTTCVGASTTARSAWAADQLAWVGQRRRTTWASLEGRQLADLLAFVAAMQRDAANPVDLDPPFPRVVTVEGLIGRQSFQREIAERRRSERLALISEFLRRVEDLWHAQQDLGIAITEMLADRQNENARQRRLNSCEVSRPARIEAQLLLGQMRILAPSLFEPAHDLIKTSEASKLVTQRRDFAHRTACLAKFEIAARAIIGPENT